VGFKFKGATQRECSSGETTTLTNVGFSVGTSPRKAQPIEDDLLIVFSDKFLDGMLWFDAGHPAMGHMFDKNGYCGKCRLHFEQHQRKPVDCEGSGREALIRPCVICGKEFEPRWTQSRKNVCGTDCSRIKRQRSDADYEARRPPKKKKARGKPYKKTKPFTRRFKDADDR
jgi:hypothetical protein